MRIRQLSYQKIQKSKAPKLKQNYKPRLQLIRDNDYEIKHDEVKNKEKELVKDLWTLVNYITLIYW